MTRSQKLLAAFFVFAGTMHFVRPHEYRAIMPPYVPAHPEAVVVRARPSLPAAWP